MRRYFLGLILALALVALLATPAIAATTQDVSVTATPSYISISNSPNSFDFGTVATSSTPNTTTGWFTITNSSTVATDIDIKANGWTGGAGWSWGAAGADTGRLAASDDDGTYNVTIIAVDTDYELKDNLAAVTNQDWELELQAPSSFSFGDEQTTTVTITASAYD